MGQNETSQEHTGSASGGTMLVSDLSLRNRAHSRASSSVSAQPAL